MAREQEKRDQERWAQEKRAEGLTKLLAADREDDEQRKSELQAEANEDLSRAEELEREAAEGIGEQSVDRERLENDPEAQTPQHEDEAEAAASDAYTDRRGWVLPGTVSPDLQQQMTEAREGGSLMGQAVAYAARSLQERDGKSWQWSKEAGKAVLDKFGKNRNQLPEQSKNRGQEIER